MEAAREDRRFGAAGREVRVGEAGRGGVFRRDGRLERVSEHTYLYHGHAFGRFRAERYHWPAGWRYRHYGIHDHLPRAYWLSEYYITEYALYGLDAPPAHYQWVRYGPDMVLVNMETGEITQNIDGAFEEDAAAPGGGPGPG